MWGCPVYNMGHSFNFLPIVPSDHSGNKKCHSSFPKHPLKVLLLPLEIIGTAFPLVSKEETGQLKGKLGLKTEKENTSDFLFRYFGLTRKLVRGEKNGVVFWIRLYAKPQ